MNSLYIGIGVAIIVALVTALVGPYFVDWTAYRSMFEREGQRIFGENVTVLGQAKLRLLPMPSVSLDEVLIGPIDRPDLKIGRLDLKLELTPLMKGEIRISELRLDHPVVHAGLDSAGALVVPGKYAKLGKGVTDLGAVGLESAVIIDGSVLLFDQRSGTEATLDHVNGTASASALLGPIKFNGQARLNELPFAFKFAAAKRGANGVWPMRLDIDPANSPYRASLDVSLETDADAPKLTGKLSLARSTPANADGAKPETGPMPWLLETNLTADQAAVVLNDLQLSVGDAETAFSLAGGGTIELGPLPKFDAELTAKQVDLDRLIARRIDEPTDPQVALVRMRDWLFGLEKLPLPGRLHFDIGGVIVGGGVLQDVDLDVHTRADGWAIDAFAARLPGRSRMTARGRLQLSDMAGHAGASADGTTFDGRVMLTADQPLALLQWWTKGEKVALDPFSIAGHVVLAAGSLQVDELDARIGSANAKGAVTWVAANVDHGERLKATISSDRFDLDQAKIIASLIQPSVSSSALAGSAGKGQVSPEINLDLDTGALRVAGQVLSGVTAKVAYDGSSLIIDQLAIGDAIGASIDLKGRIDKIKTTPDGTLDGSIKAEKLIGLTRLLEALNLGQSWDKRLAAAVSALGPLDAHARFAGKAGKDTSELQLTIDGKAAESRLGFEARFEGRLDQFRQGSIDAALRLEGPDGGQVLRQIGITAISDSISAGKLLVSVKGIPATKLLITANAEVATAKLVSKAEASIDNAGEVHYRGDAHLAIADLRAPAAMFDQPLPSTGATVPLELQAHIDGETLKATLSSVSGHLGGIEISGNADVDIAPTPADVSGTLKLSNANLASILDLGLGADAFQAVVSKGALWPTDALPGPIFAGLKANVDLTIDKLMIDRGRLLENVSTTLSLQPGRVAFDHVTGRYAGGDLTGGLGIQASSSGEVAVSGRVRLGKAALADLVWRREDHPVADGKVDIEASFETNGRSIAAMVADMSGAGTITANTGSFHYLDADAFAAIIAAADAGLELREDKIRAALAGKLDVGATAFERLDAAFSIGAGVLRIGSVNVTAPRAKLSGSALIDLGRWTINADGLFNVDPGRNTVSGAEPQIGLVFRGQLDQPVRTLNVGPLTAYLTLRAFEREQRRVEELQDEIMERDRFQRELKRLKDERVRREQEQKMLESNQVAPPTASPTNMTGSSNPIIPSTGQAQVVTPASTQSIKPRVPNQLPSLPPAIMIPPPQPVAPMAVGQ